MEEIQDSGKVWCKGFAGPAHALRIENKIFATGKSEDQTIECWVDEGALCVDLNNLDKGIEWQRSSLLILSPLFRELYSMASPAPNTQMFSLSAPIRTGLKKKLYQEKLTEPVNTTAWVRGSSGIKSGVRASYFMFRINLAD